MAHEDARPGSLGLYDRGDRPDPSPGELVAAGLSVLWLLVAGGYFVFFGAAEDEGALRLLLTLLVIFLPVAMVWVATTAMRATRMMRAESARLQASVDALRQAYVAQAQSGRSDQQGTSITRRLDELAAAQKKTDAALATFTSTRAQGGQPPARAATPAARPAPAQPQAKTPRAEEQATFALGTPPETDAPPLGNADFVSALNFPETPEDREGFAALRRALKDRPAAQLIQAAQDVLTLLAQEGIYMDDLKPDMARPETWRRFAQGARGREIAALGGIRDRSALALTAARMKADPIFRDAAHHFLRLYDRGFARFEPAATDAEISDFADTRSSRAFMLLGRVAGTFD
ncbi:hypothetical protein [Roseivivax isoporae]|uniref:Uncharacterized protein n=1 Tax=Roseivivax isoporae LMG 25204 TaxID=1449351 RepID=X7FCC8_9RHOB|nr:hypothetical protein [Roseivivax isoporae]ETX30522.1 hypothetical protein RISW2_12710 [Roseivivax isoporae LMG 25204]